MQNSFSHSSAASPEWIVFDAVGTLIRTRLRVAELYHRQGVRFGSALPLETVRERFTTAFGDAFRDSTDENDMRSDESIEFERWRQIVSEVFDDIDPIDECFDVIYREFGDPLVWELFDDVPAVIRRLQADGFRVAIASNFDLRLHAVCDALVPLDRVDRRLISSELGYRKPSPLFYQQACVALETTPDRLLMVGDDRRNDVDAPRRAGWNALWLNRDTPGNLPDELGSLGELHERLAAKSW